MKLDPTCVSDLNSFHTTILPSKLKPAMYARSTASFSTVERLHYVYCQLRIGCADYAQVCEIFKFAHDSSLYSPSIDPNLTSKPLPMESAAEVCPHEQAAFMDAAPLLIDSFAQAYCALIFSIGATFLATSSNGKVQVVLEKNPRLAALCAGKAISMLEKESSSQSTTATLAQCLIGMFHFLGLGVDINYELAVQRLLKAARGGNDLARYKLSICYESGLGIEQDEVRSFDLCYSAADSGFAEAQRRIGLFYSSQLDKSTMTSGFGQQMIRWFQLAAEQGYAKAQYDLANCYRKIASRSEIFQSFSSDELQITAAMQCKAWYKAASQKGHLFALNNLAVCYLEGIGTRVNIKQGVMLLHEAADRNCTVALYTLGKRYLSGEGVAKDTRRAEKMLRKAAELNHVESQFELAELIASTVEASSPYAEEAVAWYIAAANSNHIGSMAKLGECYFTGYGVPIDYNFGAVWYRRAAERGCVMAQHRIGCCLLLGEGITANHSEALRYLGYSAAKGCARSYFLIGQCYTLGLGVLKDDRIAAKWYKKAARAGVVNCETNLSNYYRNGEGERVCEQLATSFTVQVASKNQTGDLEDIRKSPTKLVSSSIA